jgi:hypothetical protein
VVCNNLNRAPPSQEQKSLAAANTATLLRQGSKATHGGVHENRSASNVTVGDCLIDMYLHKVLKQLLTTPLSKLSPKKINIGTAGRGSPRSKFVKAMQLVDCLLTEQDRRILIACDESKADRARVIGQKIDKLAMLAVAYLKGTKKVNPRSGAYYSGIGNFLGKEGSRYLRMLMPWKQTWTKFDTLPVPKSGGAAEPWFTHRVHHGGWEAPTNTESLAEYVGRTVSLATEISRSTSSRKKH